MNANQGNLNGGNPNGAPSEVAMRLVYRPAGSHFMVMLHRTIQSLLIHRCDIESVEAFNAAIINAGANGAPTIFKQCIYNKEFPAKEEILGVIHLLINQGVHVEKLHFKAEDLDLEIINSALSYLESSEIHERIIFGRLSFSKSELELVRKAILIDEELEA